MIFKPDWLYLRPALIVVAIVLTVSTLITILGIQYHRGMLQQYEEKDSVYRDADAKLARVHEEQDIVARFKESFSAMEGKGLFDGKQRVEWVDAVNRARLEMKLPLVRYQLSPQTPFSADYLQQDEHVSVMSSTVKLEAELLHEGDLVDLFGLMERYAPGQLHLSRCELIRTTEVFGYFSDHSNMSAVCDFFWFTTLPVQEQAVNG